MTALVVRADARTLPLPDESVDLIVTSPPYHALRDYRDDGASLAGQIGAEPTPGEYVAALLDCTREWMRVLKPTGSMWVNIGDKYAGGGQGGNVGGNLKSPHFNKTTAAARIVPSGFRAKSLMGLPWRYALRCIGAESALADPDVVKLLLRDVALGVTTLAEAEQMVDELAAYPRDDLGLTLRAEIIWCLSGGARIYARTKSGDRPLMLRDLVRAYQPKDVQVWNGEKWTQVLGWNRSPERDGAIEIELRTGERIGCTPGHRWPTSHGVVRADQLRVGDVIKTTRLPEPDPLRTPDALGDEDIGWLVGLYLAEGSRSEKILQFAGHIREEARHARLRRIAAAYDGNCAVYQTKENAVTCNINGAVLLGIIDHYVGRGRTAKSKRLRKNAWQRSDRFLAALVDGYLSGDGHFDAKNNRWRLGFSANDEWAADLRTLAARLGAKLSLRRHDHKFEGRTYPGWRGEWRWERSLHHNAKQDGEIVAIRQSRAREFYDVGVADEPHLFALASGVLTHNSKSNGLPESVTDRARRSHEQFFHFTRQPRYYSAVDEIREPHIAPERNHGTRAMAGRNLNHVRTGTGAYDGPNPLGALPGSVWEIATQPLTVPPHIAHARCCAGRDPNCDKGLDHFAAYPPALVRRIVLGWSPPGICTACGAGRRPALELGENSWARRKADGDPTSYGRSGTGSAAHLHRSLSSPEDRKAGGFGKPAERRIVGYVCACPTPDAPTRPAIVVDPFGGTGCTALVASVHGRVGLSFDLSHDYGRLARWRTGDPGERARALGVPKPPPVSPDQGSLFDGLDGVVA